MYEFCLLQDWIMEKLATRLTSASGLNLAFIVLAFATLTGLVAKVASVCVGVRVSHPPLLYLPQLFQARNLPVLQRFKDTHETVVLKVLLLVGLTVQICYFPSFSPLFPSTRFVIVSCTSVISCN